MGELRRAALKHASCYNLLLCGAQISWRDGDYWNMANEALLIEHLTDAAWPAETRETVGQWLFRATRGVTRRANSVMSAGSDVASAEMESLVNSAEAWYAARNLPAAFQISSQSPSRLDDHLAERGYFISGASEVWIASADGVSEQFERGEAVEMAEAPEREWFDCAFDEPAERRAIHEQKVRRVPAPRIFAAVAGDGMIAGCGMAAIDSAARWAGIYCMATRPEYQRMGIARRIVTNLAKRAGHLGVRSLYLQVMDENAAARSLYGGLGFQKSFAYNYRVQAR